MAPPTTTTTTTSITDNKQIFLQRQIRLLTSPLHPPTPTTTPPLPTKAQTDLLSKINNKIKSHNRLIFSAASQRHVAEQIDTLYWNEVVNNNSSPTAVYDAETVYIPRDADLTETGVVLGIPDGEVEEGLGDRVRAVVERRDVARRRVDGLRRLRGLLVPFEDVRGRVQPNLVTRDAGELGLELERLKVLVARVEGGLRGQGGIESGRDEEESVLVGDEDRLDRVLGLG